jgi:hypothetical protein
MKRDKSDLSRSDGDARDYEQTKNNTFWRGAHLFGKTFSGRSAKMCARAQKSPPKTGGRAAMRAGFARRAGATRKCK